jgi:hypothetical protein
MSTIFWSSLTESIHQLFEGKIETETKKIITATLKQEFFNAACATGNLERVNIYLAEGIDPLVDISIAIGYASSNGRIEIVDRLLFHESQINLNGALYYASCYGHIAIVDLLLKRFAQSGRINLLTDIFRTLNYAIYKGHTQIEEIIKSYIT